jgi:hypothetical protein
VRAQPELSGFVWTQLTDVQQEANGLLYFDRTPKLPVATYRRAFGEQPSSQPSATGDAGEGDAC